MPMMIIYSNMYINMININMSRVIEKSVICICENKGTDQVGGHHTAYQHLCFRYFDSTIPFLPQSDISSL